MKQALIKINPIVLVIIILITAFILGMFITRANSKVTICHATSSDTNPYVRIVVSENATSGHFENNGTPKAGHEDDILLQGEKDCPTPPVEEPVPEPTPIPTVTQPSDIIKPESKWHTQPPF